MINLTDFISGKLNKVPFGVQRYAVKGQQSISKKKINFIQQSFSQNSIGLSTLLDLQNQEENFEQLQISRIGARDKNSYGAKSQEQFVKSKSIKSELEQMRQKRKNLEKKVNQVLVREQTRNFSKFYKNEIKSDIRSRQHNESTLINQRQTSKLQTYRQSQSQYSSPQQQLQQFQSKSSILNQKISQSEQSGSRVSGNSVNINNFRQDRFIVYLKRDIYTLKCQRLIEFVKRFKSKFLMKQLSQWIELSKIIKRQQKKLCRFVFIEWKRFVNLESRRSVMVEMIRNRVQQKRIQEKKLKESIVPKRYQQLSKLNKTQSQAINIQKALNFEPTQIQVRDISKQIPEKNKAQQCSKLTLRQLSPIKSYRHHNISIHTEDHNQSYYDRYSCYTEKLSEDEEEFIK